MIHAKQVAVSIFRILNMTEITKTSIKRCETTDKFTRSQSILVDGQKYRKMKKNLHWSTRD